MIDNIQNNSSAMQRIGIYGGSFSPIHIGHIAAALSFKKAYMLDKLIIIPASVPPHKQLRDNVSADHRLNMCRIAFKTIEKSDNSDSSNIEVSDMELKRRGKSFTYDTVNELSVKYQNSTLYLLCGTDMLISFDEWYKFDEILKKVILVYVRRENDRSLDPLVAEKSILLKSKYDAQIHMLTIDNSVLSFCGIDQHNGFPINVNISSTEIRQRIKLSMDVSELILPDVERYIKNNALYLN